MKMTMMIEIAMTMIEMEAIAPVALIEGTIVPARQIVNVRAGIAIIEDVKGTVQATIVTQTQIEAQVVRVPQIDNVQVTNVRQIGAKTE